MNGQDREDLKHIIQKMDRREEVRKLEKKQQDDERQAIRVQVNEMHVCLMGDPEEKEDTGLKGLVLENTNFRKTIKYWLGGISLVSLSAVIKTWWKSFTG